MPSSIPSQIIRNVANKFLMNWIKVLSTRPKVEIKKFRENDTMANIKKHNTVRNIRWIMEPSFRGNPFWASIIKLIPKPIRKATRENAFMGKKKSNINGAIVRNAVSKLSSRSYLWLWR